jgi:WD40 repeat protein
MTPSGDGEQIELEPVAPRSRAWYAAVVLAVALIASAVAWLSVDGRPSGSGVAVAPSARTDAPATVVASPSPMPTMSATSSTADVLAGPGGAIAFGSTLRVVDPVSGVVSQLACAGCAIGDATWSPDGRSLAFTAPMSPGGGPSLSIWQLGDATASVVWTCPAVGCLVDSAAWSPDGRSIVVAETSSDYSRSYLDVVAVDGRLEDRLAPPLDLRAVGFPSWTPDGRILFTAYDGGNGMWLATIRPDGTGYFARGTLTLQEPGRGAMSPDGSTIAVLDDVPYPTTAGAPLEIRLWLIDADGSHRRSLWLRPGCCMTLGLAGPTWSPDGTKVAIVSSSSPPGGASVADIALMVFDVKTGGRTILGPADPSRPAWRPAP